MNIHKNCIREVMKHIQRPKFCSEPPEVLRKWRTNANMYEFILAIGVIESRLEILNASTGLLCVD